MCDHPRPSRLSISSVARDDLCKLKRALQGLEGYFEGRPESFLAEARNLLRRERALRLLREEFQLSDFSSLDLGLQGQYAHTIVDMLHCYAMWSNLSGNPKYAALAQYTPAPFAVMFRWIEPVHPCNNYLHKGCLDRSCREALETV